MANYKQMVQLLRAVVCGANAYEVCVLGDGVFFVREERARIFAERHDKELVEIKETARLGWLAKNKPGTTDAEDPLIKVIERALADAGSAGS